MTQDRVIFRLLANPMRLVAAVAVVGLALSGLVAADGESPEKKKAADGKPDANQPVGKDHAAKMAQGLALFKKHVRPVLVAHCVKCHGGETVESGFDLTDRVKLLRGGSSGKVAEPGKSRAGRLYERISHARQPGMPFKGDRLSDETIARIAEWIDLGAPYDSPLAEGKDQSSSWTEKTVSPEARDFWAFRPLRRVEPAAVRNEAQARTSIDRFVLEKLEAKGLSLSAPADRIRLIRRAWFDLIGLPPPPEAVSHFLRDSSDDAWSNLLDRLLASPQYGERWARHWLDISRFAESHGFEHDYDRPTAYFFRDFVIQALNQDLPYDTFVKWQIAGDEYEPDNNLALMATGFLAAGVHSTQITKNEAERHRYDEMDDMLSTTGSAMLGLSIGCARCHDHKFDPIPQRDYYRLLSSFTTTVRSDVELNLDRTGYERAKAAFDAEHAPFAAALQKFETEQIPGRLAAWEKESGARAAEAPWIVLDPQTLKSEGGATLTKLPDGSILAGGTNPQFDTYTFAVPTSLTGITAVRVEALADPSLVKGGPGRAANGNFDLTDFRLAIAPKATPARGGRGTDQPVGPAGSLPTSVPLKNPRATFEQPGLPVAAAIDENDKSGWAVDPQFGKDHAAAFELETPAGFEGGSILTFTLAFKGNDKHNFGRTRLSISTAKQPAELNAPGIPQPILETLALPADKRPPGQQTALLKWYAIQDVEWQKLNTAALEHLAKAPQPNLAKALISSEGLPPLRLHTQGADFLQQTHFLRRGDPNQKEAVAAQSFLQVLMPAPDAAPRWQSPPPAGWRTSYRRRALAEWLTDTEQGAGALLARVIVNRLWQHHLGRGIVATPNDFGARGAAPTHPELLDWLAAELIRRGWKLKEMHKLIMTSSVYMQSSRFEESKAAIDRENELLWRHPPRRLEAEIIRDSLLAASGLLDPKMYGPGTLDESSRRRSIYFTVKRSRLVPMMQVFDAPDALSSLGERSSTTVAPQALLLLNNANTRLCAKAFAKRIAPEPATDVAQAIRAGYSIAVARQPTADELADGVAFVTSQAASYQSAGKPDSRDLALADFCQVLLCLNEFVYVE
ncbi:MAG: PSD1 and planctomycete cytochrome C domain-containing protein [Deltaproteobacteria bacterium]